MKFGWLAHGLYVTLAISDHYATVILFECFSQNGRRRPFWMTENYFRSHFSPFQINTQLYFIFANCVTNWPPAAILEDRKSLSTTFLAISYQYTTFFFNFTKWPPVAILNDRKSLSIAFLAMSQL